jgi:hypothetical protein
MPPNLSFLQAANSGYFRAVHYRDKCETMYLNAGTVTAVSGFSPIVFRSQPALPVYNQKWKN